MWTKANLKVVLWHEMIINGWIKVLNKISFSDTKERKTETAYKIHAQLNVLSSLMPFIPDCHASF